MRTPCGVYRRSIKGGALLLLAGMLVQVWPNAPVYSMENSADSSAGVSDVIPGQKLLFDLGPITIPDDIKRGVGLGPTP